MSRIEKLYEKWLRILNAGDYRMTVVNRNGLKIKKSELLYDVALGLFLIYMISTHILMTMDLDFLWKPVFLFCVGLLLFNEIDRHIRPIEIIGFLAILAISCIIFRIAIGPSGNSLIMVFLFAFSARHMEFKKIAKYVLILSTITLTLIIIASYIGIIENYVMTRDNRIREFLGFRYALKAPAIFFNIVGLYIYIKKEKISIISLVFLSVINVFFFIKTDSRLSFILCQVLILISLAMKQWKNLVDSKLLCNLIVFSFIICAAIAFFLTINYNPSVAWQTKLNTLLSGRLYYGKQSLDKYWFSMLGNKKIEWVGNGLGSDGKTSSLEYLYVDSYYIQVLQRYGIIVLVSILTICTLAMRKIYINYNFYLLLLLGFKAIHCMIDDSSMALEFNTFWIAIGTYVFVKKNTKNLSRHQYKWRNKPKRRIQG